MNVLNSLTTPFRALRFALHLIKSGYGAHLADQVLSGVWSFACYPAFWWHTAQTGLVPIRLVTEHPIAADSPDHITPWGAVHNNITNYAFVLAMRRRRQFGTFLDLGCSNGRLVRDFLRIQWTAVGLEGTDAPKRLQCGAWKHLADKHLFTCDIGRPWLLVQDDHPLKFDVITAWDVLEHLDVARLETLAANIRQHSHPGTLLIVTTDNSSERPLGVELHVTRWSREQWQNFFSTHLPEFSASKRLPTAYMVRHSARGLEFFLTRMDG